MFDCDYLRVTVLGEMQRVSPGKSGRAEHPSPAADPGSRGENMSMHDMGRCVSG